jgi:hypothetical protein
MFAESFQEIKDAEALNLLEKLNPLLDTSVYEAAHTKILSHRLPFYKNCNLVEVTDHETLSQRKVCFVYDVDKENITILTGKNDVIYSLNEAVHLILTEKTMPFYVRFFLNYVRGRYGRFQLIQGVNDFDWREEPTPNVKKSLSKMIEPFEIISIDDEGTYKFSATVVFKDSLFQTTINVTKTGTVSFEEQELLLEDIPVVDSNFDH